MLSLLKGKGLLSKSVAVLTILIGLWYWANWSLDTSNEVATLRMDLEALRTSYTALQEELVAYMDKGTDIDTGFDAIEESQIDLICAARYNNYNKSVAEPEVVEIVKYRDRAAVCPVTPQSSNGIATPVSSEVIAVGTLDNVWRAYCLSVNDEDPVCAKPLSTRTRD